MLVWVIYDITKNKSRNRVAKICKQAGLYRVQLSVFLGTIDNKNELDSIVLEMEELIDLEKDSIYIFPMSKNELRQTRLLGQAFDRKLVTDEIKALFY